MNKFLGLFKLNTFLILALALSLPVTYLFETSYVYAILTILIFTISSSIMIFLNKKINSKWVFPTYLAINTILVIGLQIFIKENINLLYNALGIYLIMLLPVSLFLYKSIENNLKLGPIFITNLNYALIIIKIGIIREILGLGTITLLDKTRYFVGYFDKYIIIPKDKIMPFFSSIGGAFILLGIITFAFNQLSNRGDN